MNKWSGSLENTLKDKNLREPPEARVLARDDMREWGCPCNQDAGTRFWISRTSRNRPRPGSHARDDTTPQAQSLSD